MIDKITSKIKRYPFQTGIIMGFVICLVLIGFINLFQDNGKTLSGNAEIIREDYLRMTINEFSDDRDSQLAQWRFGHLGRSGDETLKLMTGDESVSPQLLAKFAEAVGKENMLKKGNENNGSVSATPVNPKKGLSAFGKTLLIILGLVVICAGGLYAASLIKTRKKQKMRSERMFDQDAEAVNVITPENARAVNSDLPETLFDLDELFPQKSVTEDKQDKDDDIFRKNSDNTPAEEKEISEEPQEQESVTEDDDHYEEPETPAVQDERKPEEENNEDDSVTDEEPVSDQSDEDTPDEEPENHEEDGGSKSGLDIETSVHDIGDRIEDFREKDTVEAPATSGPEPEPETAEDLPENDNADKPLVETDVMTDPNSDDELLQMIRSSKTNSNIIDGKGSSEESAAKNADEAETGINEPPAEPADDENNEKDEEDDILIHYQSSYRIGNDMYDEVFSIDQGDVFRGECGISIGETLNNTEPKAVTAFEIWLFDKDDIHTTTWYIMSDFAITNESISERLLQHGRCERIRKNGKYTLETETLMVDITVLELEYGTEMEEKNSYFTNVTFDVVARSKI